MAKAEHLELLRQGVERWNHWINENHYENRDVQVDLSGANLREVDLFEANLYKADLSYSDLTGVTLFKVNLRFAILGGVNLRRADLSYGDLTGANLSGANLTEADLSDADLSGADLTGANLEGANLARANIEEANLRGTNLSRANLTRTQALCTCFESTVLTGACIGDWNINGATRFDRAICEYVYLESVYYTRVRKVFYEDRRPREGTFKPGEFATLFQHAADTIDLIFTEGIDWQAFFQSFQDLRSQYADSNLSIQAIEKKRGGAFIVRLEVAEDADKKVIESSAKELYETNLVLMEQRYRDILRAKEGEIEAYREQSANLIEIVKLQASRPITVEATAVAENKSPKYDLSNAQFTGGFADTVQGDQVGSVTNNQTFNGPVGNAAVTNTGNMSAIQNNYGSSVEDITRLLTALRDQAQAFPTDQKDDANDTLDDLERDLAEEQPDQDRIGRRLKKLVALGAAIGTIASGAATVSGDVSTFTGNVIELTEQLGIPIEQVQLPPSGTP